MGLQDVLFPMEVTDEQLHTVVLLMDAAIHEVSAETVAPYLDKNFPREKLDKYLEEYSRPSKLKGFKELLREAISSNTTPTQTQRDFRFLGASLMSKLAAPIFTNSLKTVPEMTLEEREDLLKSWRDSYLPIKRKLFAIIVTLGIVGFVRLATDLHNAACGYPGRDTREKMYEGHEKSDFRYEMMSKPEVEGEVLSLPDLDVLIVGSGAGSGVVAQTLSEQGYKCLVLEKGKYYHQSEYSFNELEGTALYENNGAVITADALLIILAGSNFGGGTTINWSACLKTPFKVRKEWYDDFGLEWAATEDYDQCMQYVWDKMGAATKHINHSQSNKVIMEAGSKLGYAVREIYQNTGGHKAHDCGMCHLGCKHDIKQGSHAFWLRDALKNGCQFMDQVRVLRIVHKNGKATAAICQNTQTGIKFTITGPKKFIVSSGSLNTPVLLQNSGFKNKHIGQNLKLHPVTVVFGDFGKETKSEPHYRAIMTSVCTEKDDIDGKAHGAKIETIVHTPTMHHVFFPWDGSDRSRVHLLRFNSMSSMLIMHRDTTSGSVRADPDRPEALIVDYTANKFDRGAMLESALIAADMLYIQGAEEIVAPQSHTLTFKSQKPKEERRVDDEDFVEFRKRMANWPIEIYGTRMGSAHQMSTCRMSGKGPAYGACDTRGKLFEADNIYVADASTMPTASGSNPMITTMTIARHIGLCIAEDLKSGL
ncbi:long chain fatty acid oxidase [Suhomyces tanzawaensis NRRL Y-17324]|uniref:Long-chain-alcohol oxidase n=1 Tax=Suhomyces tanzawaensis NRRL Y-17324 TaxID=984487 RepID=A0A1E4SER4_9ASCO|nr:long chain fatty acid oxidase [Suhomyces tanzawaensis NRRL Y-17324]ODV77956.1 long chain fatty acid oxidase [Suhomyces tanzawaensis NRRL Y-17324]